MINLSTSLANFVHSRYAGELDRLESTRPGLSDTFKNLSNMLQKSALKGMWKEGLVVGGLIAAWEMCTGEDKGKVAKTAIFGGLATLVVGSLFVATDQGKDLIDVARQIHDGPDKIVAPVAPDLLVAKAAAGAPLSDLEKAALSYAPSGLP